MWVQGWYGVNKHCVKAPEAEQWEVFQSSRLLTRGECSKSHNLQSKCNQNHITIWTKTPIRMRPSVISQSWCASVFQKSSIGSMDLIIPATVHEQLYSFIVSSVLQVSRHHVLHIGQQSLILSESAPYSQMACFLTHTELNHLSPGKSCLVGGSKPWQVCKAPLLHTHT